MAADHDSRVQWSMSHWSHQHDDYDLSRSRLVRAWLRSMHTIAAPLTDAGAPPTALTLAGVAAAAVAVRAAGSGAPAPLSAALVLATAVFDGLDGAVAVQRIHAGGRSNRHGGTIDHSADRLTDCLFAAALARAGASRSVALAAGAVTIGYESLRSRLRRRGRVGAVVTVGERPIRVAVVCAGLMAAPAAGAAIIVLIGAAAAAQIVRDGGPRRTAESSG